MDELTDYEINKRLAEIAGVPLDDEGVLAAIDGRWREWSPLTDWSQLGPLRERERVGVTPIVGNSSWMAFVPGRNGCSKGFDLKRAICLAIIAAHQPDAGEGGA